MIPTKKNYENYEKPWNVKCKCATTSDLIHKIQNDSNKNIV